MRNHPPMPKSETFYTMAGASASPAGRRRRCPGAASARHRLAGDGSAMHSIQALSAAVDWHLFLILNNRRYAVQEPALPGFPPGRLEGTDLGGLDFWPWRAAWASSMLRRPFETLRDASTRRFAAPALVASSSRERYLRPVRRPAVDAEAALRGFDDRNEQPPAGSGGSFIAPNDVGKAFHHGAFLFG